TYGRRRQNQNARVAKLAVERVKLTHNGLRRFARVFAIIERFQRNEHRAGIGKIPADEKVVAWKLDRALHARNGARDFASATDDFLAALQARAVGQLREDDQIALVRCRDETGRHDLETSPRQHEQSRIHSEGDSTAPEYPTN